MGRKRIRWCVVHEHQWDERPAFVGDDQCCYPSVDWCEFEDRVVVQPGMHALSLVFFLVAFPLWAGGWWIAALVPTFLAIVGTVIELQGGSDADSK